MIDLTCDRLEQGVLPLLELNAPTLIAVNVPNIAEIDSAFEGYLVEARHVDNLAYTNDGVYPVLATYEIEVLLRTSDEQLLARRKATGAVLKAFIAQELQNSINSILQDGETLHIVNVSTASEETVIRESSMYEFSTNLSVICQPIIGEE